MIGTERIMAAQAQNRIQSSQKHKNEAPNPAPAEAASAPAEAASAPAEAASAPAEAAAPRRPTPLQGEPNPSPVPLSARSGPGTNSKSIQTKDAELKHRTPRPPRLQSEPDSSPAPPPARSGPGTKSKPIPAKKHKNKAPNLIRPASAISRSHATRISAGRLQSSETTTLIRHLHDRKTLRHDRNALQSCHTRIAEQRRR